MSFTQKQVLTDLKVSQENLKQKIDKSMNLFQYMNLKRKKSHKQIKYQYNLQDGN